MRKVSPEQMTAIQQARETEGATLSDLVSRFGFSKSTVFNIIKDCDSSKVQRAAPNRKVVTPAVHVVRPTLSKTDMGEAARQMIVARLMLNGLKVFRPITEDTPIDLLVLADSGQVRKCQCKYIYPTKNGSHAMNLYSGHGEDGRDHYYTAAEVDFFLGYCLDNDMVYVIPYASAGGRHSLHFWISRTPCGATQARRFDSKLHEAAYALLK